MCHGTTMCSYLKYLTMNPWKVWGINWLFCVGGLPSVVCVVTLVPRHDSGFVVRKLGPDVVHTVACNVWSYQLFNYVQQALIRPNVLHCLIKKNIFLSEENWGSVPKKPKKFHSLLFANFLNDSIAFTLLLNYDLWFFFHFSANCFLSFLYIKLLFFQIWVGINFFFLSTKTVKITDHIA